MTALSAEDFRFLTDLLREQSAISIGPGKEYLVESRLVPVARAGGYADLPALVGALRIPSQTRVRDQVVEAMTTNETSFFRDSHPFDALRTHLLPQAIARNAAARRLRIWSAASSTGQELCSIAMVLRDGFPEVAGWNVELVGTDLSQEVVNRANAGRYSQLEVGRGLPDHLRDRHFRRDGDDWVVDERIRSWCSFSVLNFIGAWPPAQAYDIVFCRNVLIYFEVPVRKQILDRLRRSLAPGGALILGGSETVFGVADSFTAERVGATVVYRPTD